MPTLKHTLLKLKATDHGGDCGGRTPPLNKSDFQRCKKLKQLDLKEKIAITASQVVNRSKKTKTPLKPFRNFISIKVSGRIRNVIERPDTAYTNGVDLILW